MSRSFRIGLAALLIGACAPKGDADDGAAATADSAAVSDSTGHGGIAGASGTDSTGAMLGSPPVSLQDSATKGTAAAKSTKSKTTGVIGRDSAFGPTFVVDSTGKMVRIPTKKP